MIRVLALLALTSCAHGSLYRDHCTHVGVRPAHEGSADGLTVRVTTDWPACTRP